MSIADYGMMRKDNDAGERQYNAQGQIQQPGSSLAMAWLKAVEEVPETKVGFVIRGGKGKRHLGVAFQSLTAQSSGI